MAAARKSGTKGTAQRTFSFSLVLAGAADLPEGVEDGLFESGCDDALLGRRDGVMFLDFEREATSLMEAVLSAVADVHRARTGLFVARVEPDDLVAAAEIARRVRRTRESVRQLVHGERGPGEFPAPVANLTQRSPIWRWTEVASWFNTHYGSLDPSEIRDASDLAAINAALELQRNVRDVSVINRLWRSAARAAAPFGKAGIELKARRPARRKVAKKRKRTARREKPA